MRKIIAVALLIIGLVTLIIWAVSNFIQPILPSNLNSSGVLFFAALTSVVGVLAGIKDIIELSTMLFDRTGEKHSNVKVKQINSGEIIVQTILAHNKPTQTDPKILHNLPQPSYSEFVGREEELKHVIGLLRPYPASQDSRITINGIGGVGKTTLALEVAHRFLRSFADLEDKERFDAIVWTSAKDRVLTADGILPRDQKTQSISDVLGSICGVFGQDWNSNSYTRLNAINTLAQHRTLLIIDNFETIDDEAILNFIQELPAPTKLIVTTRHKIDIGSYSIQLVGLSQEDGLSLIEQECTRKQVDLSEDEKEHLYVRTGGIPLAIVLSVSQIGFGYTVQDVLHRLGNSDGDITRFCFEQSLEVIKGRPAYELFTTLSLFDNGATRETLGLITRLSRDDRNDGLAELQKLSLVNKSLDVFNMLPLTRNLAKSELMKNPVLRFRGEFHLLGNFPDAFESPLFAVEANWEHSTINSVDVPIGLSLEGTSWVRFGDNRDSHLAVSGTTGSGKSTFLLVYLYHAMLRYSPKEIQFLAIDYKTTIFFRRLERGLMSYIFRPYDKFHTLDERFTRTFLADMESEVERRKLLFDSLSVRNYSDYREFSGEPLPRLIVLVDEVAEWLFVNQEFSYKLSYLMSMSRALGIHFILAGQRLPLSHFRLRSQISAFLSFRVETREESVEILGSSHAAYITSNPGQGIYVSRQHSDELPIQVHPMGRQREHIILSNLQNKVDEYDARNQE